MVFVKVRETYDLHTVKNKMTAIAIHTPKADIIKANFPGLLMQCKAYRPVAANVRIACASVLPLDPRGVGLAEGDVAPEDVFNVILYKATSNIGMSQIEARITAMGVDPSTFGTGADVIGNTATADVDSFSSAADDFKAYYGLLSDAHGWRHANPQSGLEMLNLRPYVHEVLANYGDNCNNNPGANLSVDTFAQAGSPLGDDTKPVGSPINYTAVPLQMFRGNAKPMPWLNCTSYNGSKFRNGFSGVDGQTEIGGNLPNNAEADVPAPQIVCGCIIIPPSRLHELFYRMVVEWTLEFSAIRSFSEITNWAGLEKFADLTHYQNYDYSQSKKIVTGEDSTILESDACMVSANVDINKVM